MADGKVTAAVLPAAHGLAGMGLGRRGEGVGSEIGVGLWVGDVLRGTCGRKGLWVKGVCMGEGECKEWVGGCRGIWVKGCVSHIHV